MSDLIKREDAIKSLEKVKECLVLDDQMFVDCLIDDIKRIEPFNQGINWIPCSERLPKEKQDVLLAFKHNMVVGFWEDILNDGGQAWYANSGNGWMTPTETVDDNGLPLAWMPLPKPYKGEDV